MARNKFLFVSLFAAVFLSGCAVKMQHPVPMNKGFFENKSQVIGIVLAKPPANDTHLIGADCLLCMAAASAANSSLTKHVKRLPAQDLKTLQKEVASLLEKAGMQVKVVDQIVDVNKLPKNSAKGVNVAANDFSSLKSHGITSAIIIDIRMLGVYRSYSSYIPTSDPMGVFSGAAYLVDLENNTYQWYLPVDVKKSSELAWDEPPSFPGVTKAYYQAVQIGINNIKAVFENNVEMAAKP